MKQARGWMVRWFGLATLALALVACGGGGGSPGTTSTPINNNPGTPSTPSTPTPDVRSGTYTMLAADAREYALALDFDAKTYQVTGNGLSLSGSIAANGNTFMFQPGNSIGVTGTSTTRFSYVDNAVIGEFSFPTAALPFIAPRTFITTIAASAGTYNLLGRVVDTGGATTGTTIQQGQVTADGTLRTCEDANLFEIGSCPAASTVTGTVTVASDVFTATTPAGTYTYRVATIGGDRLFLRASASSGTTRRFIVGTPATTGFTAGTFAGGTTEPAWGSATVAATAFSTTGTSPAGVTTTRSGSAAPAGANTLASLLVLDSVTAGSFFATASAQVGVVVAARGNGFAPGFMSIGARQ